jgi:predicted component of type VI protein secretion system
MSDSSFHREKQPRLARTVGARSLLEDLRTRVLGTSEFREGLEQFLRDSSAIEQLIGELDREVTANPTTL